MTDSQSATYGAVCPGVINTQQKTIVRLARIINSPSIGNQCVTQSADFDEPVPIAIVARQTRSLEHQYNADLIHTHFRHQTLEPAAMLGCTARSALILINDLDGC